MGYRFDRMLEEFWGSPKVVRLKERVDEKLRLLRRRKEMLNEPLKKIKILSTTPLRRLVEKTKGTLSREEEVRLPELPPHPKPSAH